MVALLRVVLDWEEVPITRAGEVIDDSRLLAADALESPQFQQLRSLADLAPRGCGVSAVLPKVSDEVSRSFRTALPQVNDWQILSLKRRDLLRAFRFGLSGGVPAGMIHSDSLFAPLLRHERSAGQQTVVTLNHLGPILDERRSAAPWQLAQLKRAEKFADAIVVPSHAWVETLAARLGSADRIRVVPPSTPQGYSLPNDSDVRRSNLGLREKFVVLGAESLPLYLQHRDDFLTAASKLGVQVVILAEAPDALQAASHELFLAKLSMNDWATVAEAAELFYSLSRQQDYPLSALSAMKLGQHVEALDNATAREVLDGAASFSESVEALISAMPARLAQLDDARLSQQRRARSLDRARSFSWDSSAERIWQLHADL